MEKHVAERHNPSPREFKCRKCSYMASFEEGLNAHIAETHKPESKCSECEKMKDELIVANVKLVTLNEFEENFETTRKMVK